MALYAATPGSPAIAHQNRGAKIPSLAFSARLSMAARAMAGLSAWRVSRPTIMATACRAAGMSFAASGWAIAVTWSCIERAAIRGQASTPASAAPTQPCGRIACRHSAGSPAITTQSTTKSAPLATRNRPRFSLFSSKPISRPSQTTGCDSRAKTQPGQPISASSASATSAVRAKPDRAKAVRAKSDRAVMAGD